MSDVLSAKTFGYKMYLPCLCKGYYTVSKLFEFMELLGCPRTAGCYDNPEDVLSERGLAVSHSSINNLDSC